MTKEDVVNHGLAIVRQRMNTEWQVGLCDRIMMLYVQHQLGTYQSQGLVQ